MSNESKVLDLSSVKANMLVELQNYKETQQRIVEDNPFIEITNRETYEEGKKRRTALVKARTSYQGQEQIVKDKLNAIKKGVSEMLNNEVISITKPHEEKQQEEVKTWEAKLNKKREEKAEIERIRIQGIQEKISLLETNLTVIINNMFFTTIKVQVEAFEETIKTTRKETDFDELLILVDEKIDAKRIDLSNKIQQIEKDEDTRLQQLSARQKSELNKHYQVATRIIQESNFEDRYVIVDNVKESFKTEFDFGSFYKEFKQSKEYVVRLSEKRFKEYTSQEKEHEERKIKQDKSDQKNNLSDLQNHLMQTIIGMDIDNYEMSTIDIDKLKIERSGYTYWEKDFDNMVSVIDVAQAKQLGAIEKQIDYENEKNKIQLTSRIEMIEMLGLIRNEGQLKGFGLSIREKNIENYSEEEFNQTLAHIQDSKLKIENDAQRNESLKPDIKRLQNWLSTTQDSIDFNVVQSALEHKESIDFMGIIKKELNHWFEIRFQETNNI